MKNIIKKISSVAMAFTLLGTGSAVIKSFSPQLGGTLVAHAVVDENTYPPLIFAQAHVQSKGWMESRCVVGTNSLMIGTTGQALRLEKIKLGLVDTSDRDNWKTVTGEFIMNAHIAHYGWTPCTRDVYFHDKNNNHGRCSVVGTEGEKRAIEAIDIMLSGEMKKYYHVEYRLHLQGTGWTNWGRDGERVGTTGQSRRAEALEIRLVEDEKNKLPMFAKK